MKVLSKRGLLLIITFLGMVFPLAAQTTQLVVTMTDGTEQTFVMNEDDRLYFEDNTNLIIEQNVYKSTTTIALADIRKMTCTETQGTEENAGQSLCIFPNPVHDVLTLRNLAGMQTISIYGIDGRLTKTFEASGEQAIDISELPIGLYFVKTQSNTLKMIKL